MATQTSIISQATSHPVRPPKVFQEISFNSNLAPSIDSPAIALSLTTNARMWLDEGNFILLNDDGSIVKKLWQTSPQVFDRQATCRHLSGRCVRLSAPGDHHYYHWMVDVLPKIGLLQRAGISVDNVDSFIVRKLSQPFHSESLRTVGISERQVVEASGSPHVICDELIDIEMKNFVGMTMSEYVPQFLRSTFMKCNDRGPHDRLLYVGRPKGLSRRYVENEEELVTRLAPYGFEHVTMEGKPLSQQAKIFNSARVIVSPHGGGLTNMVYCKPGARIVEIFADHVFSYFFGLANLCDLEYAAILKDPAQFDRVIDPWIGNAVTDQHITLYKSDTLELDVIERAVAEWAVEPLANRT